MAQHIDVFISSTFRDLELYREKIYETILSMGLFPTGMENFNPSDRNALQKCYDEVQIAEIFLGIYAHRYGYCPDASVTYNAAGVQRAGDGETGITCTLGSLSSPADSDVQNSPLHLPV
ncbi:MAG: DUF4062 domain-containing protein [Anaerolineae bacterium]|nr:DUF4062 domain-containing protein [Anaerolineae bacterium]